MKLYYSPGACSMAPHIVLRETGIEHELAAVALADRANHSPGYLRVNPRGRVPALDVDGKVYTEVPALLVYLASLRPDSGLLPPLGSAELARALEWLGWLSSTLHVAYAQHWRPERFLTPEMDAQGFAAQGKSLIERFNGEIEARITGPWLVGERYTVADPYLLVFYRWGNRIGIPMASRQPIWTRWVERMLERPAVRETIQIEGIGYEHFGGRRA